MTLSHVTREKNLVAVNKSYFLYIKHEFRKECNEWICYLMWLVYIWVSVLFHDHVKNNSILHIKFVVTHCECRTKQNTSTIFCLLIANHVEYDGFIIKVFNDSLVKYFSSWPVLFVFFFCFSILQFICCPPTVGVKWKVSH